MAKTKIKLEGAAMEQGVREFKMRLPERLHRRLVSQAELRNATLNSEINRRLEDSFEHVDRRSFEDIATDLRIAWGRFAARFLRMDLADQLVDAVMREADPADLRTLAQLIVEQRNIERRGLGGVS